MTWDEQTSLQARRANEIKQERLANMNSFKVRQVANGFVVETLSGSPGYAGSDEKTWIAKSGKEIGEIIDKAVKPATPKK